ncbi:PilN domain-containing protein [Anaeromicrobium sediminis]|nr:PilN domain-containing protein [Anaeromicrobium sediminis]
MRDFNFFSHYIDTKKTSKKRLIHLSLIGITITLVIGSITFANIQRANKIEKEIQDLKNYLNSEERIKKSNELEEIKRKMKITNSYYTIVEAINTDMDKVDIVSSSLMEKISSSTPKDLFIKTISLTVKDGQMQGVAKSRVTIAEFVHNLKKIDLVENVHVSIINKESRENSSYIFAIRCTFKDVNNNETD